MPGCNIGDEGGTAIGEALKTNAAVMTLDLQGEDARHVYCTAGWVLNVLREENAM